MRVSFPLSLQSAVNCICLQVVGERSFSLNHCLSDTGWFLYHCQCAKEPQVPQVLCRFILALFIVLVLVKTELRLLSTQHRVPLLLTGKFTKENRFSFNQNQDIYREINILS